MTTLKTYFKRLAIEAVKSSIWFNTAPESVKPSLSVVLLDVRPLEYRSMLQTQQTRDALIIEARCGGESQRFSMLLDLGGYVEPYHGE